MAERREAPAPAAATLALLRAIATHGSTTKEGDGCDGWPATSTARSRVIRGYDLRPARVKAADGDPGSGIGTGDSNHGDRPNDGSTSINQNDGSRANGTGNGSRPNNGGSMTVVNTALVDPDVIPVPRANALFPEMATSVFELEIWLIKEYGLLRPPSTHCAVNRNATFLPHVDSGRGAGQSVSMIYGLGDYTGGAICVEGTASDIRYVPLEFDGWRQRHWTEPYEGERYSLVWFTPE